MHRVASQFSRYALVEQDLRDVEVHLSNSIFQGYLRNIQADAAETMTAAMPHQFENLERYSLAMANLQGQISALQKLVREIGDGDGDLV